jgi:cytochrome c peroxidase
VEIKDAGRVSRQVKVFAGPALLLLVACLSAADPSAPVSSATFFATRLPPGLPAPLVPADNPISEEKVQLGRRLFYDTRLSGNGSYSCASCHEQARAFTDGRAQAVGSTGQSHARSALSLTNVAYNVTFGWADDKRQSLEAQMEVPMYNEHPIELGLKARDAEVLARLSARDDDLARFRAAFPDDPKPVTMANVVRAIASFERVLLSGNSPLDRYIYKDDREAISPAARRGLDLFFSSRLRCGQCHSTFNLSGPVRFEGAPRIPPTFHNTGLFTLDLGLFEQTKDKADLGRFRAPTLRNIAVTGPYMHDGSIPTLAKVIEHYAAGGRAGPFRDRASAGSSKYGGAALTEGFLISPSETEDLIAFLQSLTDGEFLANPAFGDPHIK